jgi:hypothetical protein
MRVAARTINQCECFCLNLIGSGSKLVQEAFMNV